MGPAYRKVNSAIRLVDKESYDFISTTLRDWLTRLAVEFRSPAWIKNCTSQSTLAMADLDEDVIHHPPSGDSAPQVEIDLSDEMQDFRFLNSLSLCVTSYFYFLFLDCIANESLESTPRKPASPAAAKKTSSPIQHCYNPTSSQRRDMQCILPFHIRDYILKSHAVLESMRRRDQRLCSLKRTTKTTLRRE